jgi:hypothetical protein
MKKKIFLLCALWSGTLLPVTNQEARVIRKNLYALQDKISQEFLIEPGLTICEVIDRNLEILTAHKDMLLQKIDKQKGFVVQKLFPALQNALALTTGAVASILGTFSFSASEWANKRWKNRPSLLIADVIAIFGDRYEWDQYIQHRQVFLKEKSFGELKDDLKHLQTDIGPILPFTTAIALVAGSVFTYSAYWLWKHKSKTAAKVAKIQQRFDRDQRIIARLKELKYANVK